MILATASLHFVLGVRGVMGETDRRLSCWLPSPGDSGWRLRGGRTVVDRDVRNGVLFCGDTLCEGVERLGSAFV